MITPLLITNLNELIKEYEKMKEQSKIKTHVRFNNKINAFEVCQLKAHVWYVVTTIHLSLIEDKEMKIKDFVSLIYQLVGGEDYEINVVAVAKLIGMMGPTVVMNDIKIETLNGVRVE